MARTTAENMAAATGDTAAAGVVVMVAMVGPDIKSAGTACSCALTL